MPQTFTVDGRGRVVEMHFSSAIVEMFMPDGRVFVRTGFDPHAVRSPERLNRVAKAARQRVLDYRHALERCATCDVDEDGHEFLAFDADSLIRRPAVSLSDSWRP